MTRSQTTSTVFTKNEDGTVKKVTTTVTTEDGLNAEATVKQLEAQKTAIAASKKKAADAQQAAIDEVDANLTALKTN